MKENAIIAFNEAAQLDEAQAARTAAAPMPSDATLKHRKNLLVQLGAWIVFNARFMFTFLSEKVEGDKRI